MTSGEIVRIAYERFNHKDFAGAVDLFHPDAVHADLLREGVMHRGRDAILQLWNERFAEASVQALIYEMLYTGGSVVAIVRYQIHKPDGSPIGPPMIVAHRFVFAGDQIIRLEAAVLEATSDEAKAILLQMA